TLYPPPRGLEHFHPGPFGDYILYLGRLDAMKRVDLLVRAAAGLRRGKVIIAGRGEESSNLQRLVGELKLEDRVQLLGYVDDTRMFELYAGARAVYYAPIDEDYGLST